LERAKVCILSSVHPALDTRIFYKEAKTLAQAGYEVTLIAQHDKSETVNGVRIIALPSPKNRFQRIFFLTWRIFRLALRQKADIYHFHDPELLLVGLLLKLLTGTKVVYDVHEDVPQDILTKAWLPSLIRRPIAKVMNFIEKQVAYHLDAIVTATEAIADAFKKPEPIVIHNYPDLTALPQSDRHQINASEFVLIYIGVINRLRGAVEMVRALEYLSIDLKVRLELIGKFESPDLAQELAAMPGSQRVRFFGWLSWEEAWHHAQSATVGLVLFHPAPNHEKALPNKLFEYMAAGLPVIASNFPLWKEIVEGNKCGLTVDPLNPREIAQAVEYLLEHPELRQEMGENGRRAVIEKYNWEREAERLLALYQRLLERARDS
jgi:glycosyltransferase involved in cell wall biosynthesis